MDLIDFIRREKAQNDLSVRVGEVKHIYPNHCTAEVSFPDIFDGEYVTFELPILQHGAGKNAVTWWMPSVGDQVLVLFLPYANQYGYILGSFYSAEQDDFFPTDLDEKCAVIRYGDTQIKIKDGEVIIGNGSEDFVALSGKVKDQLDAIKSALDNIQLAFNAHTHTSPSGATGAPITPLNHGYQSQSVAAEIVKAE